MYSTQSVVFEQWLHRKSKHLKKWKRILLVLTVSNEIVIYKDIAKQATEIIDLNLIKIDIEENKSIKKNDECLLVLYNNTNTYTFKCNSCKDKQKWIKVISESI
eukprot:411660_1